MASPALLADDPGTGVRYEIESWIDADPETRSRFTLDRARALEVAWKLATYSRHYVMVYERDGDAAPHPIARYL